MQFLCVCRYSLYEVICESVYCVQRTLFPWSLLLPLALTLFLFLSPIAPWALRGEFDEDPPFMIGSFKSPTLYTLCSCGLCVSSHLPWGEVFLNIGSFVIVMEKSATWSLIFWRTDESRSKTVKRRFVQKKSQRQLCSGQRQGHCLQTTLNHCVRYSQGRVCNPKTQVSNLLYLRKGNTQLVSAS